MSLPPARPERASNTQSRDQTVREQCKASKRFQTLPNIPVPAKSPSEPDTAGHEVSPAARGHSSWLLWDVGSAPRPQPAPRPRGRETQGFTHWESSPAALQPPGPAPWMGTQGHGDSTSLRDIAQPSSHEHPRNRAGKEGRVHVPAATRAHSSPAQASCTPRDGAPTGREGSLGHPRESRSPIGRGLHTELILAPAQPLPIPSLSLQCSPGAVPSDFKFR